MQVLSAVYWFRRAVTEENPVKKRAGLIGLCLLPIALHFPELAGWVTTNPLFYKANFLGAQIATGHAEGLLPGYPWTDPNVGSTTWSLGSFAARVWLKGAVPWWNPYSGVGLPLVAEGQSPALFLPWVLLLNYRSGLLYLKILLQISAGLFSFVFLRQFGLTQWVALIGALLFESNGTFAVMSDQPIMPIAFLPLLLFGIERARLHAKQGVPGGWRWIAVGLAFSIYAGFPETAYLDGMFAAAWCIGRLAPMSRSLGWNFVARVIAGFGIGVILAAPIIVPFLQLVGLSDIRDPFSLLRAIGPLNSLSLILPGTTMPYLFGPPGYRDALLLHGAWAGYVTIPLMLVAMLGLLTPGRLAARIAIGAFVTLAVGKMTFVPILSDIVDVLPFMPKILVARYVWPALEMSAILLTCFFLDNLRKNSKVSFLRRLFSSSIVLVVTGIGLWQAAPMIRELYRAGHGYAWFASLSVAWAFLSFAALNAFVKSDKANYPAAIAMLLIGDAVALFMLPLLSAVTPPPLDMSGIRFLHDHLGYSRYATTGPVPPNYGAAFDLASVNFNAEPTPKNWMKGGGTAIAWTLINGLVDTIKVQALESYGTRYVVVPPDGAAPVLTLSGLIAPKVFSNATMDIYELPTPAPYMQSIDASCAVKMLSRTEVNVVCTKPATILRRELAYPGWRVETDGRSASLNACGIYQCLLVPAGSTHIQFEFLPSYNKLSTVACLTGLLAIFAGVRAPRRAFPVFDHADRV